jgi:hypothetical protein
MMLKFAIYLSTYLPGPVFSKLEMPFSGQPPSLKVWGVDAFSH